MPGQVNTNCILCAISSRRAAASFVYEADDVCGIMSLDQPNLYKVLVCPRAHIETIYELSEDQEARIFQAAVKIARAIRNASNCEGLNMVQANGRVAKEDVMSRSTSAAAIPRRGDCAELGASAGG